MEQYCSGGKTLNHVDKMKKFITLATIGILSLGIGTITVNATEATADSSSIQTLKKRPNKELKKGLKNGLKKGLKHGMKKGKVNGDKK